MYSDRVFVKGAYMLALVLSFFGAAESDIPNKISLTGIDGDQIRANQLANKVVLFVNVASKCGYTPQYKGLQSLYEKYKEQGLVIVGVPCNQFGKQEPGSATDIQSLCTIEYGVSFPILSKQDVNGDARSELYQALVSSEKGANKDIHWNFEKFLVNRDGNVVERFNSSVEPEDTKLRAAIEAVLAA